MPGKDDKYGSNIVSDQEKERFRQWERDRNNVDLDDWAEHRPERAPAPPADDDARDKKRAPSGLPTPVSED